MTYHYLTKKEKKQKRNCSFCVQNVFGLGNCYHWQFFIVSLLIFLIMWLACQFWSKWPAACKQVHSYFSAPWKKLNGAMAYFIHQDAEQAHLLSLTLMAPGHLTELHSNTWQYKQVLIVVEHRERKKHETASCSARNLVCDVHCLNLGWITSCCNGFLFSAFIQEKFWILPWYRPWLFPSKNPYLHTIHDHLSNRFDLKYIFAVERALLKYLRIN